MAINAKTFKKAWKAAGGDKLFKKAGFSKEEIDQIRRNISAFDEDDISDLKSYISSVGRSLNPKNESQYNNLVAAKNVGVFNGISPATVNRIHDTAYNKVKTLLGSITPEQQAAEDLIASNAKALEQGGQKVVRSSDVEVPKEQPQPTPEQPVPKEVVTPVPKETAAPTSEQKAQNAGPQEQPTPEQPVPDKTVTPVNSPVENSAAPEKVSQETSTPEKPVPEKTGNEKPTPAAAAEPVGSGQTLQESTVAAAESDLTKSSGIPDLDLTKDGGISLNRSMLQAKVGGNPTSWGYKNATEDLFKNIENETQKFHKSLLEQKDKLSQKEMNEQWDVHRKKMEERLQAGPGIGNYIFGNELHTGAVGMAVITGTMGAAFGGHKSNADLYSSPF